MSLPSKNEKNEANLKGIVCAILATFAARFLGFLRELFVADIFGTSAMGDAFIVALSIPDILVSGFTTAIATLYIPTYFKLLREQNLNNNKAKEYNSSVLALIVLICFLLTVFTEAAAKVIVRLFAPGFSDYTSSITISMLRIIVISLVPIGVSGLFKAYGQIVNKYALMTFLGITINLSVITALVMFRDQNLKVLSWSVVLGNVVYAALCFILIKRKGFECSGRIKFNNSYLANMLVGIFPVFASNIVAEINQIIDKNFASRLSEGSVSALNYSSKVVNLITAVIGTAVSSVLFANLSKVSAEGDNKKVAREIEKINIMVMALIAPMFLFVFLFSNDIVRLLFGRGNFGVDSIRITAECLMFYSIGVIGFNFKAIWVRIYNASLDTKTPAINSGIAVGCNILLNLLFISTLKHKGLALATGLASIITDILLVGMYKKKNKSLDLRKLIKEMLKTIVSSAGFIFVWLICKALFSGDTNLFIIIRWGVWIIAGSLLYGINLVVLGSETGKKIEAYIKDKSCISH